jgi:hypothetical protein
MSNTIQHVLNRVTLGAPQSFRNMTVFPLLDEVKEGITYLALKEAFAKGQVNIDEVSEGGSVPDLKVINNADVPLLLVDGEELKGAKQNRVVNTSLLIPAKSEAVIPVSCTEAGRWHYTYRHFEDSGHMMNAKARYKKNMRVSANLSSRGSYDADQHKIWEDVDTLHRKSDTHSRTRAMFDAYEQKESELSEYLNAFNILPGQKGMLIFLNGHFFAIEYVSRGEAYAYLHEKWIKSHAIEALSASAETGQVVDMELEARRFLAELALAEPTSTHKPIGLGQDERFEQPRWGGAMLLYEDTPVHLSAFYKARLDEEDNSGRPNWENEVLQEV